MTIPVLPVPKRKSTPTRSDSSKPTATGDAPQKRERPTTGKHQRATVDKATSTNEAGNNGAPGSAKRSTTPHERFADDLVWQGEAPSSKRMGLVPLTLDEGIRTTAIGQLYGLDFQIDGKGFSVRVFFDHYNRRLRVLDYEAVNYRGMIERLTWLAEQNRYDKIIVMASRRDWQILLGQGLMLEGILKYYFRGDDAYVLSRFGSPERLASQYLIDETNIVTDLLRSKVSYSPSPLPDGYRLVAADESHIPAMVGLYRKVFRTYPSPLTDPDYIQQTMRRHVIYSVVLNEKDTVVSAASAEINEKNATAELTDCATGSGQRGKGLMYHLLAALERELSDRGLVSTYTLARARSVGINRVFHRLGYEYSGRLLNNCDISGQYEDMNIWVKLLTQLHTDG